MIIQFSVKNFKAFRDLTTLSFLASNYDKETREDENVTIIPEFNLRLLKSAVVYGANASGKSKLMEALVFMKKLVVSSSKESQKGDKIDVEPFRLQEDSEKAPSEFEVVFIHNKEMFRYGFEVTSTKVVAEWLFHKPKTKEIELFYREEQTFDVHTRNFSKGGTLVKEELIRENALMLSVAAQFNDKIAGRVLDWFKKLKTISGLTEAGYQGYTMHQTRNPEQKTKILDLLKAADLGIQDIAIESLDLNNLPKEMPKELREKIIKESATDGVEFISDVLTTHRKYDSNKNYIGPIQFSLDDEESSGTKKFFALTGPVLDVLENGYILAVDELDSKLHTNLVCKIVSLFNSSDTNPNNAQLIFNTHNTNLLDSGLFRRDQIWFNEKDRYGVSKLYSLAEFKSEEVRKSENFEDNYIRGKYGAVPNLNFENLVNS